jgi:Ca2+-binding EF-hand superfamily protein
MDPLVVEELKNQIKELFILFDEDKSGEVDYEEIFRTLQIFGIRKDIEECKEIIRNGGGV